MFGSYSIKTIIRLDLTELGDFGHCCSETFRMEYTYHILG